MQRPARVSRGNFFFRGASLFERQVGRERGDSAQLRPQLFEPRQIGLRQLNRGNFPVANLLAKFVNAQIKNVLRKHGCTPWL